MRHILRTRSLLRFTAVIFALMILHVGYAWSADPHSAFYSHANNEIFWFIQVSDTHIGSGDFPVSENLLWLVTEGKYNVNPEFIVVSGDLTDSTNGTALGILFGPYQAEWDEYKSILVRGNDINATNFYDLPGNHDAYNDQYFNYYRANSIQGRATNSTQVSWTRTFDYGTYHFLGINTADNSGDPFSFFRPWGDYAGLDTSELSFIGNDLDSNSDADLTFVFGHHPVTDTGVSNDTWLYYGASEFIGALDQYGSSLYGYGHTHRYSEELFTGDTYTGPMDGNGIVYLNINSLGKSTDNNFSVIAVDCNGISTRTQAMGIWPLVMITAPVDIYLGDSPGLVPNPYSYSIPDAADNPIRALVFDKNTVSSVQYRIDTEIEWHPMQPVAGNPYLWEAEWNASTVAAGEHTIQVRAVGTTTRTDTISVMVFSNNQPPVGGDQSVSTNEDTPVAIRLTASDPDGDALIFQVISSPAHGSLSGTAPELTYTPFDDFNGSDSFTFQAFDGAAYSNTATATITVLPVNDAPVAANDSYETNQGGSLTVASPGVLENDSDMDGDALTAIIASTTTSGTLNLNPDGGFIYTPNPGFSGADSFTYRADDGQADSTTATVNIMVHEVSQPDTTPPQPNPMTWAVAPFALDSASISMTATLAADISGVQYYFDCVSALCHDSGWQTSTVYIDTGLDPGTSCSYTVRARDLSAGLNETTASNLMAATTEPAPNEPPAFNFDPIIEADATVGASYYATLQDDAGDPDSGDTLTFSKDAGPLWLEVSPDGLLTGTPGDPDLGLNEFTVRVTDGNGGEDTATLKIAVNPDGDAVFSALSETSIRGTVVGSYTDTIGDDGTDEELTEEVKSGRWSILEHTWTFDVSGQASVLFLVQAYHDVNFEGDDFVFSYSLDNATFTNMFVVSATSEQEDYQSFTLPPYLSGTVYVRVEDTDRTKGNTGTDTLYVDDMYIIASAASGLPWPASNPLPPDGTTGVSTATTLSWTAGANATGHDVYFGVDPGNLPRLSADQSTSSYNLGPLFTGTTYYWRIDEVNDIGTAAGEVWRFTTTGGSSCTPDEVSASVSLTTVRGAAGTLYGQAIVTVTDDCSDPVSGAWVTGRFTGDFKDEFTQATDINGVTVFQSTASVKKPSFDFEVMDVDADGLIYVP